MVLKGNQKHWRGRLADPVMSKEHYQKRLPSSAWSKGHKVITFPPSSSYCVRRRGEKIRAGQSFRRVHIQGLPMSMVRVPLMAHELDIPSVSAQQFLRRYFKWPHKVWEWLGRHSTKLSAFNKEISCLPSSCGFNAYTEDWVFTLSPKEGPNDQILRILCCFL